MIISNQILIIIFVLILVFSIIFYALNINKINKIFKSRINESEIFLLGLILGFIFAVSTHFLFYNSLIFLLSIGGLFGGFIDSIKDREIDRIYFKKEKVYLGWLSDCFTGIAGSYILFIILGDELKPKEVNFYTVSDPFIWIQLIGIGIAGGYAAKSFLKLIVNRFLQQDIQNIQNNIERAQNDEKVKALIDSHLNKIGGLKGAKLNELKQTLNSASSEVITQVRNQVENYWESNSEEANSEKLNKSITIFNILIEVDKNTHENYGKLGASLIASDQYIKAKEIFNEAIRIRNLGEDNFKYYEFKRALCSIQLKNNVDEILPDLIVAYSDSRLKNKVISEKSIINWVQESTNPQVQAWGEQVGINNIDTSRMLPGAGSIQPSAPSN